MVERRFLKTLGTILAAVALVWVLAAFGLGVLLPFLLGYLCLLYTSQAAVRRPFDAILDLIRTHGKPSIPGPRGSAGPPKKASS